MKYLDKKLKNTWLTLINDKVQMLNNSKIFAGIMIIILNISSRFVNLKLSKTMESYLKHSFSKQILVFAITWMGSRDIYIALCITIIFIVLTEFILNEESNYCCLSESFQDYHLSLDKNGDGVISKEEIEHAQKILEKVAKQQK
uniref:EF-hand domain-containing protein n=1 Tax=viral metagenome TaxID=1070528 RepID=A0A6C0C420_9ZZZZ